MARQQQLQALTDIDATIKQTLTQLYESIVVELRARFENERQAKEFAVMAEAAPAATQAAKSKKESPTQFDFALADRLMFYSVEELQKELQRLQSALQAIVDQRTRVEAALTTRESRRKELPKLQNEERELLRKLTDEMALPGANETDPRVGEAQRLLIQARRETSLELLKKMEAELRAYEAENELLPLRRDRFLAEEKQLQSRVKEITDELNKRRESLIQTERRKLEEIAASTSPEFKAVADRLVKRADDWFNLAKANSILQRDMERAKSTKSLWTERFKIIKERIEPQDAKSVGSFNSLVGLMLRRQRSELPDPNRLQSQLHDLQDKMIQTETLILELDDLKAQMAALDQTGVTEASALLPFTEGFSTSGLLEESTRLQLAEKELISSFRVDASSYFDNLFALAGVKRDTINLVYDYRVFVDEHILWIKSSDQLDKGELMNALPALQWLCATSNWKVVGRTLWEDIQSQVWWWIASIVMWLGLVAQWSSMRRRMIAAGDQADRSSNTSFAPTARAIAFAFLVSLPIPWILAFVGWRLQISSQAGSFAASISLGLLMAARYLLPLEVVRQLSRKGGVIEKHFQWSKNVSDTLRNNLRWFIDLGIPMVTVATVLSASGDEKSENSLGRLAFVALMVVCGAFLLRVLRPAKGVFADYLGAKRGGWSDRLRYLWYAGLAGAPFVLAILSLMGYHYTAQRLAMLLHTSLMTLVGLLLLHAVLRRWFLLSRRKLLVAQARERLTEAQRRDPVTAGASPTLNSQVDLTEINAQTMRLVGSVLITFAIVAVAFTWSGVLPAIGVLNSIQLWEVEGASPDKKIPITLANLLLAIPIMVLTVVGARNLPGLMEIALLQHLPIENAVRYAIATLSRYAIVALGIALTFNSVGVRWGSIQWLVAALGVGLGFGLQEIFANFVSGLILLFEQPIRVGDIITLGDTTGSVSRIRMRATTIMNWDRQELIIPNKDLVTGRLLNWTLSDTTNRLKINVGIAYESDAERACEILLRICQEHSNVLKDPIPTAFMENFGDSTLNLGVRLFLASLDHRLQTRHEILIRIDQEFRAAGIRIAYPQRDLHIRTFRAN